MKRLTFLLLIIPVFLKAQEPVITPGFIMESSLKSIGKSGFQGFSVQAGMWAGSEPNWPNIGVMGGYIEYKPNDSTVAKNSAVLSLMLRIKLIDERLQVNPYYSFLLGWKRDLGIRIGWKVDKGSYIGLTVSETMRYGIAAMVSIF